MDREEIIINLKLLEQVEKGQKISTRDSYLNIETVNLFVPLCVRRWKRQESRDDTIKTINRIINDALIISKKDPKMKFYLEKAKIGIMNLKETYSMCHQTCARIDTILDKIKDAGVPEMVVTEEDKDLELE